MQFVDNGMLTFALSLNESGVINDIGSDKDDDEIIGATSADGMPLTRDDALIEHMSEVGLVLEDEYVDINNDEVENKRSDAFGGIIASEGYVYTGKLVFICFGPTSKYFAGTLAMGGRADRTVEEKKEGSRKAQRKVTADRNNVDREVGFDRGLTMQSKMQCAMMAQNEDNAEQRHCDMRMMMIMKQIKSSERLVEIKLKTSERMNLGGSDKAQVFSSINLLMEKLKRLNEDLETMMKEKRTTNPIVGNVLAIAAKAMGLAKCENEDLNNNPAADFVSDILK
jgi:hypothetical protein